MGKGARNYAELTVKRLFALSGNKCAKCEITLILNEGTNIAQICHIAAANEGGERYDHLMTDEQRASFENLILLCGNCHKITNNVQIYDTDKLKKMKAEHELKYSGVQPSEALQDIFLSSIAYDIDFTEREEWGILKDIIKYALDNPENTNLSDAEIKSNHKFRNTKEKAKINFPESQLSRFAELFRNTTARKIAIEKYLEQLSNTDPIQVDELNEAIISKYCEIKGVSNPDEKVSDIKFIEALAQSLIPVAKIKSPAYQAVAKALAIQSFEFCAIGEKTIQELQNAQLNLFD